MDRRAPGGRRPSVGALAAAALVMIGGFLLTVVDPAAAGAAQTTLAIADDDTGRALFSGVRLAPGHAASRCLRIAASSADAGAAVRLGATDVTGPLATELRLRVEIGDGAWFGDCSGFTPSTPTPVFDGTLADLAAAVDGADTGWVPAAVPERSFRITVALAPGVTEQGELASGSFVWRLTDMGSRPVPAGPTDPTAPTGPTGADGPPITVTEEPGTPPRPAAPSPGRRAGVPPEASPTAGPRGPQQRVDAGRRDDREDAADLGTGDLPVDLTIGGRLARLGELSRRAVRTAAAVATAPEYPLSALALALLFLAVQDRIDRRDPKLAAASSRRRDLDVVFPDLFARTR